MMKAFRISKCDYIKDISGIGAAKYGGRWNKKGTFVLYTAESASLAMLESVVHISNIVVDMYCLLCLTIPENHISQIFPTDLPENWDTNPPPDYLKDIGTKFIAANKFLALKVPSAIMPEECNILLNPAHPDFKQVKQLYIRSVPIDNRLIKSPTTNG